MSPVEELRAIGPEDPDAADGVVGRLGVHRNARRLLARHRANHPQELTTAQARRFDEDRSRTLDLEEAFEEARSAKRARVERDDQIEGGSVRGEPGSLAVVLVLRRGGDHGRSFKVVVPYDDLRASQRAYDELLAEREGTGSTSVVTDEDAAAVVEAAEARERAAREAAEEAQARVERLEDPEPWEGYDEQNADDVAERVKEGGAKEFGTAGLSRIKKYEDARKARKGVLTAVDEALAAA